ncbi:hypothetical protein Lfu02_57290 [Longispora fulva]|nr:hypothetical protein Lfu02_57290 [Longispora fulva]
MEGVGEINSGGHRSIVLRGVDWTKRVTVERVAGASAIAPPASERAPVELPRTAARLRGRAVVRGSTDHGPPAEEAAGRGAWNGSFGGRPGTRSCPAGPHGGPG